VKLRNALKEEEVKWRSALFAYYLVPKVSDDWLIGENET